MMKDINSHQEMKNIIYRWMFDKNFACLMVKVYKFVVGDDEKEHLSSSKRFVGWWYGNLSLGQSVDDKFEFDFEYIKVNGGGASDSDICIWSDSFYRGWLKDSANTDYYRSENGEELMLYFNNSYCKEEHEPLLNTYYLEITPLAILFKN